jgi:hypothetical protein
MDGKDTVSFCTSFSIARVVFERERYLKLSHSENRAKRAILKVNSCFYKWMGLSLRDKRKRTESQRKSGHHNLLRG